MRGGVVRKLGEMIAEFGGGGFGPMLVHQEARFLKGSDQFVRRRVMATTYRTQGRFGISDSIWSLIRATSVRSRVKTDALAADGFK